MAKKKSVEKVHTVSDLIEGISKEAKKRYRQSICKVASKKKGKHHGLTKAEIEEWSRIVS